MGAPRCPRPGFTLIELMIVVAIIGILAAIAVPKFAALIRKSGEGACKGGMGTIRSALEIYYGDMEGTFPDDPYALTIGSKYLSVFPSAKTPDYHSDSVAVLFGVANSENDANGWMYNRFPNAANYGTIWINCTHTDTAGSIWSHY